VAPACRALWGVRRGEAAGVGWLAWRSWKLLGWAAGTGARSGELSNDTPLLLGSQLPACFKARACMGSVGGMGLPRGAAVPLGAA
jgi:hypothetical protein